jgi:exopolysaccharide biosynthesis polyprenyl glycosylphosphotransferase
MKTRSNHLVETPIVAVLDVLLVNVAAFVAFSLQSHIGQQLSEENFRAYLNVAPTVSLATLVIFYCLGLYTGWLRRSKTDLAYGILASVTSLIITTTAISFWQGQFMLPRKIVVLTALLQVMLIMACRLLLRHVYCSVVGPRRVLVIAESDKAALRFSIKFTEAKQDWFRISGWLLGDPLSELSSRYGEFDAALITPGVAGKGEIVRACLNHGKDVLTVPGLFELSLVGSSPVEFDDLLMFAVQPPRLTPMQRILKRGLDLVGSLFMIVVASPLLLVLPIIIRCTSRGPALFRQKRLGRDYREYSLLKFRTMMADAERLTGPVLAAEDDPRVTRFGKLLRATRLDELPQLFNVLRGDMSLVGPRPERDFFVRQFCKQMPEYELRFAVKPGITGFAQVSGHYSTTAERKLRFDLMYIYDYSLLLDIKILVQTLRVVLHRHQAEGVQKMEPTAELAPVVKWAMPESASSLTARRKPSTSMPPPSVAWTKTPAPPSVRSAD